METKEIFVLIYLIGYFAAYLIIKFARNRVNSNSWSDIILTIIISLFSWLTFLIGFLAEFENICEKLNINIKPPKWL